MTRAQRRTERVFLSIVCFFAAFFAWSALESLRHGRLPLLDVVVVAIYFRLAWWAGRRLRRIRDLPLLAPTEGFVIMETNLLSAAPRDETFECDFAGGHVGRLRDGLPRGPLLLHGLSTFQFVVPDDMRADVACRLDTIVDEQHPCTLQMIRPRGRNRPSFMAVLLITEVLAINMAGPADALRVSQFKLTRRQRRAARRRAAAGRLGRATPAGPESHGSS